MQVGRDSDTSESLCVLLRHMTRITYLDGLSSETEPIRLCRRKAAECQRTALTTIDPNIRLRFTHLAKLWREMADEAARTNVASTSKERGVVVSKIQIRPHAAAARYISDALRKSPQFAG
jgi:hypothetical protein